MLPEKPKKDKWINAKGFSWFFEYDPCYKSTEEEWYSSPHTSNGMVMQALADEAEYNGVEIIKCKDCKYCAIYHHYDGDISVCARMYQFQRVLFDVTADKDFCSKAERRDTER